MADPATTTTATDENDGWMSDVQRALALLIIGLLALATFALVIRLVISANIDDVVDLAKIMLAAMVNMALIALGFFFGNNKAKQAADATQGRLLDKLTVPTPPAPTPPAPPTTTPWWSRLSDAEKTAITALGPQDPRVAAFITASQVGAATRDDLDYLQNKGLLAPARVVEIAS